MSQGVVNRICKCNLSPSCCHYLTHNYIVLPNGLNWCLSISLMKQTVLAPFFSRLEENKSYKESEAIGGDGKWQRRVLFFRVVKKDLSEEVVFQQRPKWRRGRGNKCKVLRLEKDTSPSKNTKKATIPANTERREERQVWRMPSSSWSLKHLKRFIIFSLVLTTYCTNHNPRWLCHCTIFNTAAGRASFITSHPAKELTVIAPSPAGLWWPFDQLSGRALSLY